MLKCHRSLFNSLFFHPPAVAARFFHPSPAHLVKKKMPPKKAAAPEKKTLLGRPSNNLKIGIVG
jgi:obg-like ATPase 1